jgi:cardiolipin synthase
MFAPRDIPNLISIARILLVFPVVWALLDERFGLALILFVVAGVSDALDGYLAKHYSWQSHLGGILDPLADKFLLISTYVCLGWLGELPWWLVALVLLRDVVIVAGAVVYNFRVAAFEASPLLISKLNTLMQLVLAVLGVVDLGLQPLPPWLLDALILVVALTTLASGVAYVVGWGRRALDHGRHAD